MAVAFLSGATRLVATTEPTPKNVPCAERGQQASGHQQFVGRRQRAGEIAHREDGHQADQHGFAGPAAGQRGEKRRPDDDAERVTRNQQAGHGDGDVEIPAEIDEQAHDDEFGNANPEGAGGKGIESERHGKHSDGD